ncbi:MAG: ATP-binding protein [Lachnospiraceae bacterium]
MQKNTKVENITVEASIDNMKSVLDLAENLLTEASCPLPVVTRFLLSIEEIYVNVASYAYGDSVGNCRVQYTLSDSSMAIDVWDSGIPFNPLEREDPDITLKAEDRKIGGLGIFMTKTMMDEITYEYKDGQNHIWMKKSWAES